MRRRLILVGAVVILGLLVVGIVRHRAASRPKAEGPQMATVTRGKVLKTVTADGTLRALTSVSVKSDAGGKIIQLAVDVGDVVKKGDLIAKIDPTDTQTAYTQALAGMESSQAQLTSAQAQARAQPAMTQASIGQAAGSYQAAEMDLRRLQSATQPRDRADARTNLDKAKAALASAKENLSRLKVATHPVSRAEARSGLDQANAALRQAQQNLARLKQATHPQAVINAQAALDKARSDLTSAEREVKRHRALYDKGFVSLSTVQDKENARDSAQASFDTAQERVNTVKDDQAAELAATEAQVQQAEAARVSAQRKWDAIDSDQGAERRSAEAAVQEAEAGYSAALRRWNTLDSDQAAEMASSRAKVDQARNSLASARANSVQQQVRQAEVVNQRAAVTKANAEVSQTKTSLGYTTITAPRDGVILQKDVEEGTIVNSGRSGVAAGVSIVELGDLSTMYVDVNVDETDLADIKVGQQVEISVESLQGRKVTGSVTRVDPQATTTSNITTVKVEIEVLDHDTRLMPGLSAECTFLVGERDNVLTLPAQAVRERDGKHTVTVLAQGKPAQGPPGAPQTTTLPVEVGLTSDDTVEIVSGLQEGDKVVLPELGTGSQENGPRGGPPGGGNDFINKKQ
jgi:HlyD family secretion protein